MLKFSKMAYHIIYHSQLHRNTSIWYTVFGACAVLSFIFRVLMMSLLRVLLYTYTMECSMDWDQLKWYYNEITMSCGWFGIYIRTAVPSVSGNGIG